MGFEIVSEPQNADLKVIFDQENQIYIANKELHAYTGNEVDTIKIIYQEILETTLGQNIETLEVPLMQHSAIEVTAIYPIVFKVINDFFQEHELNIYLNLDNPDIYKNQPNIENDLFQDIQNIMDQAPAYKPGRVRSRRLPDFITNGTNPPRDASNLRRAQSTRERLSSYDEFYLEDQLNQLLKDKKNISFGERLIQIIDEKGYPKDSLVYNKAMIDRRLFHNIISGDEYLPKKNTVILLALALELNEEEAKDFLSYAGYSFSNTRKDQIILYCIRNHYYKIMYINGYLYDKGLKPLLTID